MISIKSQEDIKIMVEGGRILAGIMRELEKKVVPGITTLELERVAQALLFNSGVKSAFKGYGSFPAVLCASVNQQIVHGAPLGYKLQEGDILSLDLGILHKGFYSDMAVTLPVGKISKEAKKLIEVTRQSLYLGIKKAKAGNTFGDIGNAIQRYVEAEGFNVVRNLCGHGIGRVLHEEPEIPNFGERKSGLTIKEDMVFCIEPMVTAGDWKLKKSADGFGFETQDGSLSCHFEHTVVAVKNGAKILTVIQ